MKRGDTKWILVGVGLMLVGLVLTAVILVVLYQLFIAPPRTP